MSDIELSVFVDESGNFTYPDERSRFYIIALVLHHQADSITEQISTLNAKLARLRLENLCFHAGPIIRHEDGYEYMNWELRNCIFSAMMAFARKVDFQYHCICVDKKFVNSASQIIDRLKSGLDEFALKVSERAHGKIKVYYDCGQSAVTRLLHESFINVFGSSVEFAQKVRPVNYKLFQVADLVCAISLIDQRLQLGLPMTSSEERFFGGARKFKRLSLKQLQPKAFNRQQ